MSLNEWKPNARQKQILGVLAESNKSMAPSAIGEACGQPAGAKASKWTYHALKTLVAKGRVTKMGVGLYQTTAIPTEQTPTTNPEEPDSDPGQEG